MVDVTQECILVQFITVAGKKLAVTREAAQCSCDDGRGTAAYKRDSALGFENEMYSTRKTS
jgi:hypothetical protein